MGGSVRFLLLLAILLRSVSAQDGFQCNYATDIDQDDDGLIELCDLDALDAVRYQLDGSGYRESFDAAKITAGCPSSGCNGYELRSNLDFNSDDSYRDTTYKEAKSAVWSVSILVVCLGTIVAMARRKEAIMLVVWLVSTVDAFSVQSAALFCLYRFCKSNGYARHHPVRLRLPPLHRRGMICPYQLQYFFNNLTFELWVDTFEHWVDNVLYMSREHDMIRKK